MSAARRGRDAHVLTRLVAEQIIAHRDAPLTAGQHRNLLAVASRTRWRATMSQSEIAAVNRQFEDAARKGDLERLASLYTRDAIALPPDSPMVRGRDNIKQMWGTIAQQIGLKDVRLNTIDLDVTGDTAYEVGEANLTIANGSAAVKFVVVWKKVDGQWHLHRDIWNAKGA
jgi:uncharacterized protein (TIGR02246 family)